MPIAERETQGTHSCSTTLSLKHTHSYTHALTYVRNTQTFCSERWAHGDGEQTSNCQAVRIPEISRLSVGAQKHDGVLGSYRQV